MTDPTGLHRGDAATTLATWPDHCAQACVTSPPYLRQRVYGDSDLEGGLQATLFDYIEWLATTLAQVRRVLRPDGLLWCNIGDKCLAGNTSIYYRAEDGPNATTLDRLHAMYADHPERIQVWTGSTWATVAGIHRQGRRADVSKIELRSGERITATSNHLWPLHDGRMARTDELRQWDVIASTVLPDEPGAPDFLPDHDVGWTVGLFLAEGHIQESAVIFSGHENEHDRHTRLAWIAEALDAKFSVRRQRPDSKGVSAAIHSPIAVAIINRYIGGDRARTKHLRHAAWKRSDRFLGHLLAGYLDGDGHERVRSTGQWELRFTDNGRLVADLRTLAARVGTSIRLRRGQTTGFGKRWNTFAGDLVPLALRRKPDTQIMSITPAASCEVYDLELDDEPHLFALSSGVLSHNSNGSGGAGGDWKGAKGGPGKFHDKDWPAQSFLDVPGALIAELLTDGWRLRADIIWDKGRDAPEDLAHIGRPRVSHERILLFAPTAERPRWYPSMLTETGSVWHFPPGGSGPAHLAPFPDELARRCILPSTLPGDLVIDPFHGSGTAGRVATQLGRRYAGIDLYADVPASGPGPLDEAPGSGNAKRRHVDLKDLQAIGLKPAVLYRDAGQLAEGQTLDQVTAEHRLTPEQVAHLDEMTRPQGAAS